MENYGKNYFVNSNLSNVMQHLFGRGLIIQGDGVGYSGTISAIRNTITGLTFCNFNASLAYYFPDQIKSNDFDWGIHYQCVAKLLGFTNYTVVEKWGSCIYYNSDGAINKDKTGYGGYIGYSINNPRSEMGRYYQFSLSDPIWNSSFLSGGWSTGTCDSIYYISGSFAIYLN